MAAIVVIFDFDKTIIDCDSDNWVVDELGVTELFNQLLPTMPWNSLMVKMMEEIHAGGKTIGDIVDVLKRTPIHPRVVSAIKSAYALGCELRIVSDANMFFIETILEHLGLRECFSEINTNPGFVDDKEKLRIFPYHDFTKSSHGCSLCPPNMCKGMVIERIQALLEGKKRIIYLGDGIGFHRRLQVADDIGKDKCLATSPAGSSVIVGRVDAVSSLKPQIYGTDSKGYLVDEDGFDYMKISFLRDLKAQQRSLRDYSKTYARSKYYDEAKPWNERCDVAIPCGSQSEIDQADAINLVNSGCHILVEGSNMPCTPEAVDVLKKANVIIAPAMASGAGGVVAGEIELNNHECNVMHWSPEDFESKLQEAMKQIFNRALKAANDFGYQKESPEALLHGAVISAFLAIQSMTDQGCV